jgi:hypothetical protein
LGERKREPIVEKEQRNIENLQNYAVQNESFWAEVVSLKKVVKIGIKMTNNDTWYLITNGDDVDIADSSLKNFSNHWDIVVVFSNLE